MVREEGGEGMANRRQVVGGAAAGGYKETRAVGKQSAGGRLP